MTYRPHPTEPDGLVVEDSNGNRLVAIPTAAVELLGAAAVIEYTRDGVSYRFKIQPPGGHLVAVPPQPDTPPTAAAEAVRCPKCQALDDAPNYSLGCVWCGTAFPVRR